MRMGGEFSHDRPMGVYVRKLPYEASYQVGIL